MITLDRHHLPTDVPTLHGIILQLLDGVDEQQQIIAKQQATIAAQQLTIEHQQQQIEHLTQRVSTLERQLYGKRSERGSNVSASVEKSNQPFVGHGRRVLPDHLPRERQDHELLASTRVCQDCGGFLTKIGDITSEQLDCRPSQLYVIEHVRHKYACRKCQGSVITASMPAQPIDKGLAAPGLLAEVLVNKYQDALPLYRQSQRFKRAGLMINRSTLCEWVLHCARLMQPLVNHMTQHHLKPSGHLHTDDTPIRILHNREDESQAGRFWIYTSKGKMQDGKNYPACTVYQFTPHRRASAPHTFLQDFKGYLQADAYSGYDDLYKEREGKISITEVACWAHARRYFIESSLGAASDNPVHEALKYIGQLYTIEHEGRDQLLDTETIAQWRQDRAPPVLNALHQWLVHHKSQVLPKSTLAAAINYTLNHWQALTVYITDGHLEIDNNRSERGLRPLVVGRKNYLFVGNNKGGQAAAVIYSLIETCKQHDLNPWAYLKDVLSRISTHSNLRIEELLPWQYQTQNIDMNTNAHGNIITPKAA